ncbi:TorF family putative porin [Pseudomonas sp. RIT-PI-AD]|uniref:TorF family putative porin n=1 Tax=Pseudomonas sp. RIT-PI-AD TaxID=3035294 RepID=UPI0021DAF884|nr:TorF family putative porin [Pseudomonas sp. RIT-PI-AD]
MYKFLFLLGLGLLLSSPALAQVMRRDIGDFELKLATTPTRSMAQGLVKTDSVGSFHGGLDLSHDSGWYIGQWSPNMDLFDARNLEIDSYTGFKHVFDDKLGYELGMIRFARPQNSALDRHQVFAGMSLFQSRLGAALGDRPGRFDGTLYADLGTRSLLGVDITMKYGNHDLDTPVTLANGGNVRVFNDWSLNLTRPWLGIDLDLSYSGSSLRGQACSLYSGLNSQCDGYLLLKASRPLF